MVDQLCHEQNFFSLSKFVGYDSDVDEEEDKTVVVTMIMIMKVYKDEECGGDCDGESVCR